MHGGPRDGSELCPSDAGRLCLGLSRSAGEPPFTMRKEGLGEFADGLWVVDGDAEKCQIWKTQTHFTSHIKGRK